MPKQHDIQTLILLSMLFFSACQSKSETVDSNGAPATEVVSVATDTPLSPTDTPPPTPTDTPSPDPTETNTSTPLPTETPTPVKRATATPGSNQDEAEEESGEDTEANPDDKEISANTQPEAVEILQKSAEAVNKIETITQEQITIISSTVFTQTQHMVCQQELPDKGHCVTNIEAVFAGVTEPITQSFEMVYLDEQFWLREAGQDSWEQLPEDLLEQSGFSQDFKEQYSSGFEFITNASITGERRIDGEVVFEIEAEVSEEMFFALLDPEIANEFLNTAEDLSISTTLWISKGDFIVRKQEVIMIMTVEGETLAINTQTANSGINEPVNIPDPTAE